MFTMPAEDSCSLQPEVLILFSTTVAPILYSRDFLVTPSEYKVNVRRPLQAGWLSRSSPDSERMFKMSDDDDFHSGVILA